MAQKTTSLSHATKATSDHYGFFVSAIFADAWKLFKAEWLKVWGILLLPFGFSILYSILSRDLPAGGISLLMSLLYFVAQLVLGMGVTALLLQLIRGQKFDVSILNSMFTRVLNYVAVSILYGLIVFGGFLLLIIPGVVWMLKFMYAPYLVIDKGLGPIAALKQSARMTEGVRWDLLGFSVASQCLVLLGLLALVVGLVVTVPVATLSMVMLYDVLVKRIEVKSE